MKLGSCIHLEELRSTLCSSLRLDLFFQGSLSNVEFLRLANPMFYVLEFLRLGHFLRNYKGWSHLTWVMHTS